MPGLLDSEECSSCGNCHDFYLPNDNMFSALGVYEYVCPQTGRTAQLRPSKANKIVHQSPPGAVTVKRIDVQ
jgi:hypothetical protein